MRCVPASGRCRWCSWAVWPTSEVYSQRAVELRATQKQRNEDVWLLTDSQVRFCLCRWRVRRVGELKAGPLFSNTTKISQSHKRSRMIPEWFWKVFYILEAATSIGNASRSLQNFQKLLAGFQKLHTFNVNVTVNLDLSCFRNISRTREYMLRRHKGVPARLFSTAEILVAAIFVCATYRYYRHTTVNLSQSYTKVELCSAVDRCT